MRVALISCVAKKLNYPAIARDMYVSPLFKGAFEYAKINRVDKIFILSAKYGLLNESELIEPYDESLNNKSVCERKKWASMVLSSLSKQVCLQTDEFVLLAGIKYRQYLVKHINNVSIPLQGLSIGKQLAFYKKHLSNTNYQKSIWFNKCSSNSEIIVETSTQLSLFENENICDQLHSLVHKGRRFDFSMGYNDIPANGIYIMFEKGEIAHGGDRIVRIGTHTGDKQLKSRIYQHFENENKNRSIFRKNIGRCFLHRDNNPYLHTWELDTTTKEKKKKYADIINRSLEEEIEKQITKYIQTNLSFCLFNVPLKDDRMYYEARMIGSVSRCQKCNSTQYWLGRFSPVEKVRESGLWQIMELYSNPLNEEELSFISKSLI